MLKRFMPLFLTAIATWQWRGFSRKRENERRRLAKSRGKPTELTTWEGEGGALRGSPMNPLADRQPP